MKVAVIGAGVAGMCAAIRLKEAGGNDVKEVVVFEKQERPGGLLQSTYVDGHWWDNGAFKFGGNNYLAELLPDAFKPFDGYDIKVWQKGRLQKFPFSLKSIFSKVSTFTCVKLAVSYLVNTIRCTLGAGNTSLEHWLRCRLTPTFLELSGLQVYIKKLQGLPLEQISFLFGEQRLHYLHKITRPLKILKTLIGLSGKDKVSVPKFVYPSGSGVGSIATRLEKYAQQMGIVFHYGTAVAKISSAGSSALNIEYGVQGRSCVYRADYVISSMPINDLAAVYEDRCESICLDGVRTLRYMDLQMVFFIVNKPFIISKYLTLYSFEEHHQWKRLVARSLPDGTTSVLVETTVYPDQADCDVGLVDNVTNDLTGELNLFNADEILCCKTAHVEKAYPVYSIGYEETIEIILGKLESEHLYTVGRNGRFFYSSTPKIIEQAKKAVDQMLQKITGNKLLN